MIRIVSVSLLLAAPLLAAMPVAAQAPAVQAFVASFATPTPRTGKIARWEDGVCPRTTGQQPAVAAIVNQRVKDLAAFAGAPVNDSPGCAPNIEIVFTASPQALLDNVREHDPDFLGFAESGRERERLAAVTRPIQAWYTTQTRDLHGLNRIDSARRPGEGVPMKCFTCGGGRGPVGPTEYLSDATYAHVSGNRVSDGVRSAFYHILIVADPGKLQDHGIGPLADYIAMLALTQVNSPDNCRPLPSIVNMLAKDCTAKTEMLTKNDATYLRGLYKMSADRQLFSTQKGEIADSMEAALAGR